MTHGDIHDLTAAFALDALDLEERAEYEEHLQTCERCREELASFSTVTGALAAAAAGPAPRAELRSRILEEAQADGAKVVPFTRPRRAPLITVGAVAAVAAAVAIGLGIWALSTSQELDDTRVALAQQEAVTAVLADPEARSVPLQTGAGFLVVDSAGRGVLVLDSLAPAPNGSSYQIWVIEGDRPTPAGLFSASTRVTVAPLGERVPESAVVAVTVEPDGGSQAPTSEPVIVSASA